MNILHPTDSGFREYCAYALRNYLFEEGGIAQEYFRWTLDNSPHRSICVIAHSEAGWAFLCNALDNKLWLMVWVRPSYRHKGNGTMLAKALFRFVEGEVCFSLNDAPQFFYKLESLYEAAYDWSNSKSLWRCSSNCN